MYQVDNEHQTFWTTLVAENIALWNESSSIQLVFSVLAGYLIDLQLKLTSVFPHDCTRNFLCRHCHLRDNNWVEVHRKAWPGKQNIDHILKLQLKLTGRGKETHFQFPCNCLASFSCQLIILTLFLFFFLCRHYSVALKNGTVGWNVPEFSFITLNLRWLSVS